MIKLPNLNVHNPMRCTLHPLELGVEIEESFLQQKCNPVCSQCKAEMNFYLAYSTRFGPAPMNEFNKAISLHQAI